MISEHVEVLRDLSEVCRAAIKAGDWKVDGACDPDSLLRRADAAIASLSAPQPPAEAQAQGGRECCHSWEDYGQMNVVRCNKCEARAVNGYEDRPFTAPPSAATPLSREHGSVQEMFNPSAPVGVEGLIEDWESDLAEDRRDGVAEVAIRVQEIRLDQLRTLAQQPAAVDGALRGEVAEWKRVASAQAELHGEAEARAERLAEALREVVEYVQETAHHNAPAAAAARAALRDHDQEARNG